MDFSCKGKGKDSTGKGKDSARGQGHLRPRTRITAEKFSGHCTQWKGKMGWIQPAEEIAHEKASLRGGALFVSMEDIQGAKELPAGSPCVFHVYEDDSGLGADEVEVTGPPDPSKIKAVSKGGGKAGGKNGGKWQAPAWQPQQQPGSKGCGKPGMDPWMGGKPGMLGKGDMGKGKGKNKMGGKGHSLERTRVSAEKFLGVVEAWKGKFGWIKPAETIDHPKAGNTKGLFVSKGDLMGVEELTQGSQVEFHIAEDSSGLCAEEVIQF